jgi:hypothetical protein
MPQCYTAPAVRVLLTFLTELSLHYPSNSPSKEQSDVLRRAHEVEIAS